MHMVSSKSIGTGSFAPLTQKTNPALKEQFRVKKRKNEEKIKQKKLKQENKPEGLEHEGLEKERLEQERIDRDYMRHLRLTHDLDRSGNEDKNTFGQEKMSNPMNSINFGRDIDFVNVDDEAGAEVGAEKITFNNLRTTFNEPVKFDGKAILGTGHRSLKDIPQIKLYDDGDGNSKLILNKEKIKEMKDALKKLKYTNSKVKAVHIHNDGVDDKCKKNYMPLRTLGTNSCTNIIQRILKGQYNSKDSTGSKDSKSEDGKDETYGAITEEMVCTSCACNDYITKHNFTVAVKFRCKINNDTINEDLIITNNDYRKGYVKRDLNINNDTFIKNASFYIKVSNRSRKLRWVLIFCYEDNDDFLSSIDTNDKKFMYTFLDNYNNTNKINYCIMSKDVKLNSIENDRVNIAYHQYVKSINPSNKIVLLASMY
jgi:hypothetical protein